MRSSDKIPDRFSNLRLWEIQPLRDFAGVVFIGCTLWLLFDFRRLFAPVLIAVALAYICDPLMQAATKKVGLPRWVLAAVFTLMLVAGAILLVIWVGPLLSDQVEKLATNIPQYAAALEKRYGLNVGSFNDNVATFANGIRESPVETLAPLFTGTGRAVGIFGVIVAGTMEVLLSALLLPIFFFLFAWHLSDIRLGVDALLADGRRARLRRTLRRMDQAVSGFLLSRLLIAVITAGAFVAGWSITGVPYALLLGILTGVLTVVPYMAVAGWPLALLAKYVDVVSSGGSPVWSDIALWPSVVFLVVAFVEGWILTPWIQSQTMELSALTILLAVLFGGAIGGIMGLLLAIPITACVKIVLEEYWRLSPVLTAVPPSPKISS